MSSSQIQCFVDRNHNCQCFQSLRIRQVTYAGALSSHGAISYISGSQPVGDGTPTGLGFILERLREFTQLRSNVCAFHQSCVYCYYCCDVHWFSPVICRFHDSFWQCVFYQRGVKVQLLTTRSLKWPLFFRFPHQNPVDIILLTHTCHSSTDICLYNSTNYARNAFFHILAIYFLTGHLITSRFTPYITVDIQLSQLK